MGQDNLIELTSLQLTETRNFQPILTTKWLFHNLDKPINKVQFNFKQNQQKLDEQQMD